MRAEGLAHRMTVEVRSLGPQAGYEFPLLLVGSSASGRLDYSLKLVGPSDRIPSYQNTEHETLMLVNKGEAAMGIPREKGG